MANRRKEIWDNVMSGKYQNRDWFDYADASARVAVSEIAMRGAKSKTERYMLGGDLCPMGYWGGRPSPRSVTHRLPIWC